MKELFQAKYSQRTVRGRDPRGTEKGPRYSILVSVNVYRIAKVTNVYVFFFGLSESRDVELNQKERERERDSE